MKRIQWCADQAKSYLHTVRGACPSLLLASFFAAFPAAVVAKIEGITASQSEISELPHLVSSLQKPASGLARDRSNRPETRPLDKFPTFNSEQLDQQLRRYARFVATYGVPDVLIVGSSRSFQGIDPLILQQSLAQQGHQGVKVFNFGINGATAQVVNWLLQDLLSANHLPRLIVWGDGARAFNSGRIDHTFNKIVTSHGYQLLSFGVRPELPAPKRLDLGQICVNNLMPLLSSPFTASQSLNKSLSEVSFRSLFCQQSLQALIQQAVTATFKPLQSGLNSEALGFRVVNTQFIPATYFQRYSRVPGQFDADYRNFNLAGQQAVAFQATVRFANQHQVPLVFVNLPLTEIYLDSTRKAYEKQFQVHMQALARSRQWTFIDLISQQDLKQNRYFEDPSHINRYGAAAIATEISKKLIRPLSAMQVSEHQQ
ncbi:hypothetical protein [Leptodesmis sp.]|uniref:hypothetical protein n=1 Tax=Leptodesmis sp. TaxID=3100501 RepID=UPI004053561E